MVVIDTHLARSAGEDVHLLDIPELPDLLERARRLFTGGQRRG